MSGAGTARAPIRVAIIDDEPIARAALRLTLQEDAEVVVVGDCIGVDAPELIERARVELIFLDVQMPEMDGFAVLEALAPQAMPAVIFATAHDEYAVRAFEVHAIDYLLKPYDDARLFTALARAKQRLARHGGKPSEPILALLDERARGQRYAERFLVRERGKVVVVKVQELDWIEASDYYATLHAGGEAHLIRQTMAELEASLDPQRFVRVHRGAIVNVERIREVHPLFRGDCTLVLSDGTKVRLSRTRRAELERLFGKAR